MAEGPRYRVNFRRRREGRTDYRQRQRLLRGRVPRAVVRISLRNANVQFISYDEKGDKVLAAATSKELAKLGWTGATGNLPAAYLTGYLAGKRASQNGVEEAVLDIGLKGPARGSAIFAALKGMLDAGIEIPHGEEVLPADERINGAHIDENMGKMVEEVKSRMEAK
ncbi:MAG: 50S ribosomal protein L18 [Methanomassiliicoccus sp.]|nr:50S ribosomal protein L18 [Methanomassiliicoccus sp.]